MYCNKNMFIIHRKLECKEYIFKMYDFIVIYLYKFCFSHLILVMLKYEFLITYYFWSADSQYLISTNWLLVWATSEYDLGAVGS
jgi:hypothetical protein